MSTEGISLDVGKALTALHTPQATCYHGSVYAVSLIPDHRLRTGRIGCSITMQGRAGKAPKREMVIESPQQYKSLAEIEAEVEAGSQVAAVSLCCAILYIEANESLAFI